MDRAFTTILDVLPDAPGTAAALVLAKADQLRSEYPIDYWLRQPPPLRLDAERIHAESKDIYAYLHQRKAQEWLAPFSVCRRATLHAASATGGLAALGVILALLAWVPQH